MFACLLDLSLVEIKDKLARRFFSGLNIWSIEFEKKKKMLKLVVIKQKQLMSVLVLKSLYFITERIFLAKSF
jgi:hypothetical protein